MALYTFSKTVNGQSPNTVAFTYKVELSAYVQPSLPDEYIVTCRHYFKFSRNIRYNAGKYGIDFSSIMDSDYYEIGDRAASQTCDESWHWDSTKIGVFQDLQRTTTHFVKKGPDGIGRGTFNAHLHVLDEYFEPLTISIDTQDVYFGVAHNAPKISNANNTVLGDSCSITFTPNDINHYYKLTFSAADWHMTTDYFNPGAEASYTYDETVINDFDWFLNTYLQDSDHGQIDVALDAYIVDGKPNCRRYVKLNTEPSTSAFDVLVPENIVPTIGSATLTPQQIAGLNQDSYLLVQHKNGVDITVADCEPGIGSRIISYTYSGPGISQTTTSANAASNIVTNYGDLEYSITVTDSRDRSTTVVKKIVCYEYFAPRLSFSAYRSNADGTENSGGGCITCEYTPKYPSVNDTNTVDVEILYKKNSNTNVESVVALSGEKATGSYTQILKDIDVSATYSVYAVIKDYYGGRYSSSIIAVLSAARIMNLLADGTGVAFGKIAETSNLLDSAWAIDTDKPEQTMKNFTYRNVNLVANTDVEPNNDTPKNWGSHGNLATTLYDKANQIVDQPSDKGFVVNITNGPNVSDVHQIWAGQSGGSLSHRNGDSSGWNGSWKTILDSENYKNYVDNDYVNTMSISWDKIVDTPTTLDGYGIIIEEKELDYIKKPTVIYNSTTGAQGTIELYEDAGNFAYLEIYYTTHDGMHPHSTRMYSPNNKHISISCIANGQYYGFSSCFFTAVSTWIISGTTMTFKYHEESNLPSGGYPGDNVQIKIMRILGYK